MDTRRRKSVRVLLLLSRYIGSDTLGAKWPVLRSAPRRRPIHTMKSTASRPPVAMPGKKPTIIAAGGKLVQRVRVSDAAV